MPCIAMVYMESLSLKFIALVDENMHRSYDLSKVTIYVVYIGFEVSPRGDNSIPSKACTEGLRVHKYIEVSTQRFVYIWVCMAS